MRRHRDLALGTALCLTGLLGLAVLSGGGMSVGGMGMMGMGGMMGRMMGGGGMMDREDMKSMMRGMMGGELPSGIDPADLPDPGSPGARLLTRYCTQCHELPSPGLHTAKEWPPVEERMNRRMRMMARHRMMMGGFEAPSRRESGEILAYLRRHALTPADEGTLEGLDTPAGRAFREVCSRCHALPDPGQHTAAEWPDVVARMQRNMAAMGREVPDGETLASIVTYLERHSDTGTSR